MDWNGRPLSKRKKVQILVALTLLAWATQTLMHQWGFGAEVPAGVSSGGTAGGPAPELVLPAEKFVPGPPSVGGGTLELRGEATVLGTEVRLKQICRWSNADAAQFLAVADLVVMRFDGKTPFKSISLDELKATLGDARANVATIRFSGPLLCTVRRSDAQVEPKDALQQWIDARQTGQGDGQGRQGGSNGPAVPAMPTAAQKPAAVLAADRQGQQLPGAARAAAAAVAADASPVRTLRQLLAEDLAVRLDLPVDQLQVGFNPKDERVLNLSEPQFRFNLEPVRVRNLGEVEWNVLVVHENGTQKVPIAATARAWQKQVLVARPLSSRQVIRPEDVAERRTLVDRVSDEPLLTLNQAVGQQASRDLRPGTVMTSRTVEAVPLVKPGQYVTITVYQGSIRVKTVGKAMEGGSYGQSVRVKNEATNDVYEVILTGPQEGTIGAPAEAAPGGQSVAAAR